MESQTANLVFIDSDNEENESDINYTLFNGDCLIEMKKIKDKTIDMILCDLPYGMTKNKWDIVIPFDKLWKEYIRKHIISVNSPKFNVSYYFF